MLTFNMISQPSIISNEITRLYADTKDHIWVATERGLSKFNLRTWSSSHYDFPRKSGRHLKVTVISEGIDGTIYIATDEAKLYRISDKRLVLIADLSKFSSSIHKQSSIDWIAEPIKGQIWLVYNGRFLRLQKNNHQYTIQERYEMPGVKGNITRQVYFDPSGKIVFHVQQEGVFIFNTKTNLLSRFQSRMHPIGVNTGRVYLTALKDGKLGVLVNTKEFFVYDVAKHEAGPTLSNISNHISKYKINSLFTRGKKTYGTFNNGIAEIEEINVPFKKVLSDVVDGGASQSIRTVYKAPDSLLYISSYKDGFFSLNERTGEKKFISKSYVYKILPWSSSRMLLASEGAGLIWYEPKTGRWKPLVLDTMKTRAKDRLMMKNYTISLSRENDSLVWAGSYNGVVRLNTRSRVSNVPWKGIEGRRLAKARVNDILQIGAETYFASTGGLFHYNSQDSVLKQLLKGTDLAETFFYTCKLIDRKIWAGTNGMGILLLNERGQLLHKINTGNGLAGNVVYALDQVGRNIIISTDQGLSIMDQDTRKISNYSRLDGLPSNELNHSANFVFSDDIYLGSTNGLVSFKMVELLKYKPAVFSAGLSLTRFTRGNTRGNTRGTQDFYAPGYQAYPRLVVGPDVNYFSLHFGGVHQAIDQLEHYYRITSNSAWQKIGQQQEVNFANMAPGEYQVQLMTRLNGTNAPTKVLQIPLTVKPAYYQTWWFKLGLICLSLVIGWLFFRYRMSLFLKEQRLRTKIAGDLHDEVGSALTRIFLQADLLRIQKSDNVALNRIAESSKEALSTMSDLVWSIDARFDQVSDLVARIKDYMNRLEEELDIHYTLTVSGDQEQRMLNQSLRQNFFLIFKEAVNNAIRYGADEQLQIVLNFEHHIYLSVTNQLKQNQDQTRRYQGGQGSQYMVIRAARMHGQLTVIKGDQEFVVLLIAPY